MRFQKRLNLGGGLRLNFSKSGIGVSAGVPGFRVGVDSKKRKYVSVGIPGTGVSERRYLPHTPATTRVSLFRKKAYIPQTEEEYEAYWAARQKQEAVENAISSYGNCYRNLLSDRAKALDLSVDPLQRSLRKFSAKRSEEYLGYAEVRCVELGTRCSTAIVGGTAAWHRP